MLDFAHRVKDLAKRSAHASKHALTEEATKTSVILPFIQTIGFDVFNLEEVIPEFISDVGLKKGEKVDFALKISGNLSILIEAKPITMSLGSAHFSQLYRYFAVTEAKLAILTNGREIWFFSDVDEPNKMDKKPFFTFDLQLHDDAQVAELAKFQKDQFSMEAILASATNLKYIVAAAAYLKKQLANPDDEFVKMVGRQIYGGMLTKSVVEQLKSAVQSSLDEVIRNRIQDKLNVAFRPDPVVQDAPVVAIQELPDDRDIHTTEEEMMAFMMVKAIAARYIDVSRITIRDSRSYCSVFVDDNNRRPVCRFYFNGKSVKHLGLFDAAKVEEKQQISALNDVFKFSDKIEAAVKAYA
jgi:hypothetical protein